MYFMNLYISRVQIIDAFIFYADCIVYKCMQIKSINKNVGYLIYAHL